MGKIAVFKSWTDFNLSDTFLERRVARETLQKTQESSAVLQFSLALEKYALVDTRPRVLVRFLNETKCCCCVSGLYGGGRDVSGGRDQRDEPDEGAEAAAHAAVSGVKSLLVSNPSLNQAPLQQAPPTPAAAKPYYLYIWVSSCSNTSTNISPFL